MAGTCAAELAAPSPAYWTTKGTDAKAGAGYTEAHHLGLGGGKPTLDPTVDKP